MIIGVPKEIMHDENRVSSTPETVTKMVKDGFKVIVEKGAGAGSFYLDEDYVQAGAEMLTNPQEIYDRADIILKVKEPQFNQALQKHEVEMMHKGQILITFIHPAAPVNHKIVKRMAEKGVVGLTLDGIPRISRAQSMDALSSMSVCAGYKGILMAANDIAKFIPMVGSAVGVLKPSTVFVLGTGVAGLRAVATAKSLGAIVYSADIRPEANEQAMSLGARIVETGIPAEIAVSPDGKHANKLSEKWLQVERENLKDIVSKADIVFCSALLFGHVAPILLTEEMVKSMKPGSCIVDISIDQGGNCAITTPGERDIKHGVIIEGIKNIPGMLPSSSTWMFAQNIYNLLKYLIKDDKIELDTNDEIVSSILVTNFEGQIVHQGTLEAMNK
ncbi:MAG TPA: NAD(P) transhydrogenase subunit alpha [Bacilli bacterium]|jgi:NAD(P) transhydrogenase subunit alpha|nr:NAD(P) transhydrogenase subunit alpha [Acholeplasmataceae bacterium]HNZ78066.1 NAD(P) transhydrogenase subunit alpha [Bacilli bacterium]HOD62230.1 NAD(P) transhydrogenase subunit alpha [Bacilli bacterium]HOH61914.1 NAD(P) transhydrogenase subunit alpha [Bacilli bacterium]HPM14624.1 NAD(P) transhydrogenase subunit alpha [Bacilli bacterium]